MKIKFIIQTNLKAEDCFVQLQQFLEIPFVPTKGMIFDFGNSQDVDNDEIELNTFVVGECVYDVTKKLLNCYSNRNEFKFYFGGGYKDMTDVIERSKKYGWFVINKEK